MATITKLTRTPAKPGRTAKPARLEVDGEEWGTCSDDILAEFLLYEGKVLPDEDLDRMAERIGELDCLRHCHMVISQRACTAKELRDKLVAKEFAPAAIDFAMGRAQELRLLDDGAYARSFVAGRMRKGHGPARIRRDLLQRGIARELLDEVLAEAAAEPEEELEACRALVAKRFARDDLADPKVHGKAMRLLIGRGFATSRAHDAIRAVQAERAEVADS